MERPRRCTGLSALAALGRESSPARSPTCMQSHAIICDHVQSRAPTSVSSDSNKIAASADESAVRTDESAEVRTDESAAGETSTIAVEGSAAAGEMAALAVGVTTPASTISTNASAATCGGRRGEHVHAGAVPLRTPPQPPPRPSTAGVRQGFVSYSHLRSHLLDGARHQHTFDWLADFHR